MEVLLKRVRRIHVGTHSNNVHHVLKELFKRHGWAMTIDYHGGLEPSSMVEGCHQQVINDDDSVGWINGDDTVGWDSLQTRPDCLQMTAFGPVYVRDGMLSFANPALVAGTTLAKGVGGAGVQDVGHVYGLAGRPETSAQFRKECVWPDQLGGCRRNATHWILSQEGQKVLAAQLAGIETQDADRAPAH